MSLGTKIKAYDPQAIENAKLIFGNKIEYANSAYETIENTDALILLTEWNEFRKPDFDKLKNKPKTIKQMMFRRSARIKGILFRLRGR